MDKKLPVLAFPTKRIKDIHQTIDIFCNNLKKYNNTAQLAVFDDSPAELSTHYLAALPIKSEDFDLLYIGHAEKKAFRSTLINKIGAGYEQLINQIFRPCYGGNRNYTALYSLGRDMISIDDDMRPYGLLPSNLDSFNHEDPTLISHGHLEAYGSNAYQEVEQDVLSAYLALIGKPLHQIPENVLRGEMLVDSAMDLTTNASLGLAHNNSLNIQETSLDPNAVIAMAQAFRTGTNDIDALDFVDMILENSDVDQLHSHSHVYVIDFFRPAITNINWRMDCGVAAYHNINGIPPFIPSDLRFEDYLYRLWIQQPGLLAAHVGLVMTHLKSPYMRFPHANEVFNEELTNLIKNKFVGCGFTSYSNYIDLNFDGVISKKDTDLILEKIKNLVNKCEIAEKNSSSQKRKAILSEIKISLKTLFLEFDEDFFFLEVSRIIEREVNLIKATNQIWPKLNEIAATLNPLENYARRLS